MKKNEFRNIFFTSLVAVTVLFTGCGGGGDSKSDNNASAVGQLGGNNAGGSSDNTNTTNNTNPGGSNAKTKITVVGSSIMVEIPQNLGSRYQVIDLDPNNDKNMTYSKVGGEDKSKFYVFNKTGEVQFTVRTPYDNPKDANADNVYNLIVSETDANGAVTNKEINVTVIP